MLANDNGTNWSLVQAVEVYTTSLIVCLVLCATLCDMLHMYACIQAAKCTECHHWSNCWIHVGLWVLQSSTFLCRWACTAMLKILDCTPGLFLVSVWFCSKPASTYQGTNMHCNGGPASAWKDVHCQEACSLSQLDWYFHQRCVYAWLAAVRCSCNVCCFAEEC